VNKKLFALKCDRITRKLEIYQTNADIYDMRRIKTLSDKNVLIYSSELYLSYNLDELKSSARLIKNNWIKSAKKYLRKSEGARIKIWDELFQKAKYEEV